MTSIPLIKAESYSVVAPFVNMLQLKNSYSVTNIPLYSRYIYIISL
jgi:hypothetical protein